MTIKDHLSYTAYCELNSLCALKTDLQDANRKISCVSGNLPESCCIEEDLSKKRARERDSHSIEKQKFNENLWFVCLFISETSAPVAAA